MIHFKREKELESLLYRLVFTLLPCLYQAERVIEKSNNSAILFYIYETDPTFDDLDDQSFCVSTLTGGVIEIILEISGFNYEVVTYNCIKEKKGIVYTIENKSN